MMKDYLQTYDYNLPLLDAFKDIENSMTRRLIAAVSMKEGLTEAWGATGELIEAFECLASDAKADITGADSEGADRIAHMLEAGGDDYQRRVYYLLSETPVDEALSDLKWLMAILTVRGQMYRIIQAAGVRGLVPPGYNGPTEPIGCPPYPH